MPRLTFPVDSLRLDGQSVYARCQLTIERNDPLPGVSGLTSWHFDGTASRPGELPEEADADVVAGGRRLAGRVLRASMTVQSSTRGTSVSFRYLGTGPLTGWSDEGFGR